MEHKGTVISTVVRAVETVHKRSRKETGRIGDPKKNVDHFRHC